MLTFNFSEFPVLKTERLQLRLAVLSDAEQVLALRGDELAMKYIPRPRAKNIADAIAHIESIKKAVDEGIGVNWAICLNSAPDAVIGFIGFVNFFKETNGAEIGYMLHPDFWGRAYVPEAMKAVEKYGFETLSLSFIEAKIDPANLNSKIVLLKNGYALDRSEKATFFFENQYLDTDFYIKFKDDI